MSPAAVLAFTELGRRANATSVRMQALLPAARVADLTDVLTLLSRSAQILQQVQAEHLDVETVLVLGAVVHQFNETLRRPSLPRAIRVEMESIAEEVGEMMAGLSQALLTLRRGTT